MKTKNKELRTKVKRYLRNVESTNIHRITTHLECQEPTTLRLCFELLAQGYITAVQDKKSKVWTIKKV